MSRQTARAAVFDHRSDCALQSEGWEFGGAYKVEELETH